MEKFEIDAINAHILIKLVLIENAEKKFANLANIPYFTVFFQVYPSEATPCEIGFIRPSTK